MLRDVSRLVGGSGAKGLGARIVTRREQLGLSQLDLADLISQARKKRKQPPVAQTTLSVYESADDSPHHRLPGAEALIELADALRCSADYLLGRTKSPEPWLEGHAPPAAASPKPDRPTKATKEPKKAIGLPGAGKSLEQAQAEAVAQGRRYVEHEGRAYRLRKDGWEPV